MALKLPFTSPTRVDPLPEAYARVSSVNLTGSKASFSMSVFEGAAERQAGKAPVHGMSFSFDYDMNSAANVYAQAYAYLKTRDEFAGAVDI